MARNPTILVVGRSGQLAQCLALAAERNGRSVVALGRPDLDVGSAASIAQAVENSNPTIIVNASAYTAVDKAEAEPEEAFRINCTGAANLAAVARKHNLPFIHISTDYVFDGSSAFPYREDALTAPLGIYGKSKRDGELAVLKAHPGAVIFRTSWVYSAFGANFVKTMMRLAESQPLVRVVDDQRGSPTSAHDLASALFATVDTLSRDKVKQSGGIYHLTATGETSWHGFAETIFAGLKNRGWRVPALEPIQTKDYPTPARRPAYSVLDCTKAERVFGIRLPHWQQSIASHITQHAIVKEPQTC